MSLAEGLKGSRRWFINNGLYIIAGNVALIAVPTFIAYESQRNRAPLVPEVSPMNLSPTPVVEIPISPESRVRNEALRLNIKPSARESALWRKGFTPLPNKLTITSENKDRAIAETEKRLQSTIDLMLNSENQHMREAAHLLVGLYQDDLLFVRTADNLKHSGLPVEAAASFSLRDGKKLGISLTLSLDYILNRSISLQLAHTLVHEAEHINKNVDVLKSLDPKLPVERKFEIVDKKQTEDELVEEEALAYAKQVQAYIITYGLGIRNGVGTATEKLAAKYIELGNNPLSTEWLKFVKDELVK